jgi:archaellum component FlaF (FlaF/FlaG flagellin family)
MADSDKVAIIDTEASNTLKTLSWSCVKSLLKTYFDTIYQALGSYLTSVSGDTNPSLGGNLNVNGKTITSASNGDVTITPNGTGKVVIGTKVVFNSQAYYDEEVDVTGTTFDLSAGNRQKKTMSANVTMSITVPSGPASGHIRLIGDASTTYTIAWPSSSPKCVWLTTAITSVTAGKSTIISWLYDGTNLWLSCPGLVTTP